MNIEETIEYYSIFSGFPFFHKLQLNEDIFTCIEKNIINKIEELKPYFIYDSDANFQNDLESILTRIAIGDRKNYTVYKKEKIPHMRGKMLYKSLFEKNIIQKELSRERPLRKYKGQLIKKSLRHYEIQNKIYFTNNFTRFWFTFISPILKDSLHVNKKKLLKNIQTHIQEFISFTYEQLSNELLILKYKKEDIINYGSYWDKNIEIDLFIKTNNGKIIAGEAKWKNTKVCKNVLNSLIKKCEIAQLEVTHFVLCSKSGFSNELKKLENENILLIQLQDFEELY